MSLPDTLEAWLAHCERLHPKSIDMSLDRVRAVRDRMGLGFDCPVVIVGGIYFNQGHVCSAGSKLLVQEPVYEKFIGKLKTRLLSFRYFQL